MRSVQFHQLLDDDNALRVEFELEQGRVLRFAVQLECRFTEGGKLKPVIRYDTAHGFAHCDRLHPRDTPAKSTMNTQDYNEVLTFAIDAIVNNWQAYRRRFATWLKKSRRL